LFLYSFVFDCSKTEKERKEKNVVLLPTKTNKRFSRASHRYAGYPDVICIAEDIFPQSLKAQMTQYLQDGESFSPVRRIAIGVNALFLALSCRCVKRSRFLPAS
jgi:hypothetical protein